MYPVITKLEGLKQLNYPDVCTEEPKYGKAFCEHHCVVALNNSIPSDLKEYIKFKAQAGEINNSVKIRMYNYNTYRVIHNTGQVIKIIHLACRFCCPT